MKTKAETEFEILKKQVPDAIILPFEKEILALVEKFNESGQSGGSAPYTAGAISKAVEKLCLQEPICPLTGEESEWGTSAGYDQNNRAYGVFRDSDNRASYLRAIVWQGQDSWDTFTGIVEGITSSQYIKKFPFKPKTFYIDVIRELYDKNNPNHKISDSVSCGTGDYVCFIKDKSQLDKVFEYYDKKGQKLDSNENPQNK